MKQVFAWMKLLFAREKTTTSSSTLTIPKGFVELSDEEMRNIRSGPLSK